ncbi:hypothetical protein [Branchiibius sp. NY16-3462-2]|uniref:hypothetical protein n=1 Tax=Branchiibius sp. NY16-3462-2 TaxID=1807500 RepID=UPI0007952FDB|nr:hypothetical protein [Branchiibius sp. NY16-3462-2]KYH43073.1 hypothetical protein AZH51_06385 [Branchiibius sp. NY16-3462-2]
MTRENDGPPGAGPPTINRRTLAKGAAWTTPVLLVGAVAPVQAASVVSPCQCLVGFNLGSNWSRSDTSYTFTMNVTNSGCGALSALFGLVNAGDTTATYAVTYSDGTSASLNGSTSGNLLLVGTVTGTLPAVPTGKSVTKFCVTFDISYRFVLTSIVRTCVLSLCWTLGTPTATSGNLTVA